ncbi:MAG TPA: protein kinase [Bryobacteraceae bacterium]|nr:protein kinase [Bryobacteraceae bacterium]
MATTLVDSQPTVRTGPAAQTAPPDRCVSFLFADFVCPSTESGEEDAGARRVIAALNQVILSTVQSHGGSVIKTLASSVMAEFDEPVTAVRAAVELQRRAAAIPDLHHGQQHGLRVGIYSLGGERSGIEMFGTMVSGVVSLTKQASFGQILISRDAHQRVEKHSTLQCNRMPATQIDDGADNEEIFEVIWRETATLNLPSRYEVLSEVGKGGMGIVHKVRDRETDEIIALKILRPEIAGDPAMQENLRREVCLARKVTHKNVCRIHELNRSNGAVFISMELVEGESLQSMLQRVGTFSWPDAVNLALQVCAGLREAHVQGIVHRDLKPTNIMVDANGGVKVMDFGIARQFQGTGQLTNTMVGTPSYMAPEQLELKRVDARTDIYALGLLLYEMVTGVQPFTGETPIAVALKHLREEPTRPRELMPALPPHAEEIILKCLRKDSAKRFQSVDALTTALRRETARRPAVSQWDVFVTDIRGAAEDLLHAVQPQVDKAVQFARSRNWSAVTKWPAKRAIGAALGATVLLTSVIVLSVIASRKNQVAAPTVIASATAAVNPQSATTSSVAQESSFQPASAARPNGSAMITSSAVNLGMSVVPAAGKNISDARTKTDAPLKTPEPKAVVAKQRVKPQTAAHPAVSPSAAQHSQPALVASTATDARDDAAKSTADDASRESAAAAPEAAAFPDANAETKVVDADAVAPGAKALYLEVGSFKDPTWADNAVDKLRQLGLHSISYHKTVLWMQSYQVRVGPYANQKDLEEARERLIAEGFKPHAVK